MKKIITLLLCLCVVLGFVACGETEATYKLGMGVVVDLNSSATNNAQVDATVATVVLDADDKIVTCRIDAVQNKMDVTGGAVNTAATFQTKMEKGAAYGMGQAEITDANRWMDNNGDGVVKEWDAQAKAFEAYVVGKTATQISAMETQLVNGHNISTDEALLTAGCTIQIGDFRDAVVKACEDAQGTTFTTAKEFTLGVAATSFVDSATVAATAAANGTVAMYSDFACAVVADGVVLASLNDAIQPTIGMTVTGEIATKNFTATKRELKEAYGMGQAEITDANRWMDNNGDGIVLEWYKQSKAFSDYVVGKTATQIAGIETELVNGHYVATDDALLTAGCSIQITAIKAVVAKSANNAR